MSGYIKFIYKSRLPEPDLAEIGRARNYARENCVAETVPQPRSESACPSECDYGHRRQAPALRGKEVCFGKTPNPENPNRPSSCRNVFTVDVTLQILTQTTAAMPTPDLV